MPKKLNREELLTGYKTFCSRTTCEACPYYMESDLRDVCCGILYILDKVETVLSQEPEAKKSGKSDLCELLGMMRKLLDLNLGRQPHESQTEFQERKYDVLNAADEMLGRFEPNCKE